MLDDLWNELLEQKPSNDDLRYIVRYIEALREGAQKLIKRPKGEIIKEIMRHQ